MVGYPLFGEMVFSRKMNPAEMNSDLAGNKNSRLVMDHDQSIGLTVAETSTRSLELFSNSCLSLPTKMVTRMSVWILECQN
jgi:hypothetical protein